MTGNPAVVLKPENRTAFNVGWLASHYGLPRMESTARLMGMETGAEIAAWAEGHDTATETDLPGRLEAFHAMTVLT